MDFEKFLSNGITVRNPNHKENSKKKNNPPKLIKSNKLEDYDNSAPAAVRYVNKYKPNFGPAGHIFNPIEDLYNTYKPKDKDPEDWQVGKDVEFNRWTDQDTINRAIKDENRLRAENQSWIAQIGDMLMQGIVSEFILGTVNGISGLIDSGLQKVGLADNDYSNWVSQVTEDWQNAVRDEFKIYRENPDASWDFTDFGWWTNAGVSALTSASLLIPSTGIIKGASWLGKASKLGRAVSRAGRAASYKTSKFINWATKPITGGNRTRRIMKSINNGSQIATTAFLQRTMENHMEAREVYNEVYNEALNKLNSFTEDDRDKFFRINPNLKGKSNEEIAKYVAGESADETFTNDYAMLLMDIVQFNALKNLWRGKRVYKTSGGLSEFNKRMAANVNNGTNATANKVTLKDRLNYRLHHPLQSLWRGISSIEFSEAFEEIYQGIQTEKGKEVAKRIFDPNYRNKSIYEYLQDGHITEQGFFGILGAAAFRGIGEATGRLYTEIDIAYNRKYGKDKYDDKEIALRRLGYQKAQIEEIKGREALIKKFNSDMKQLEDTNVSTRQVETYTNGKPVVDENGNVKYRTLTDQEKLQEKEDIINEFIATMAINSANAGTYDLLKEYIQDPEVKRLLGESADGEVISRSLLSKMDDVYEKYKTNIYNIYQSLDYVDENVAKLAAQQLVANELGLESAESELNSIKTEIEAASKGNDADVQAYLRASRINLIKSLYAGINDIFTSLEKKKIALELDYANGVISKQAYDQYKRDLNTERRALHKYANDNFIELQEDEEYDLSIKDSLDDEYLRLNKLDDKLKSFLSSVNITGDANNVPNSIKSLLDRQIEQEYEIVRRQMAVPKTQSDYNDIYSYAEGNLGLYTQLKYMAAAESVRNWLSKQQDLTKAAQQLSDGSIKEIQEELDILKIGHNTTRDFIQSIEEEIKREQKRREKEAKKEKEVKVDGEVQNGASAERNKQIIDEAEKEETQTTDTKPISNEQSETDKTDKTAKTDNDSGIKADEDKRESHKAIVDDSSTGEGTQEKVDDFYIPEEEETSRITDDTIPYTEEEIIDIESQSAKDTTKVFEAYWIDNDSNADGTAQNILMSWIGKDKSILDILKKGYNTEELNELIDKLTDELILQGISKELAPYAARNGIKMTSKILYNYNKDNAYLTLLNQLALNAKINPNNFASSKKFIGKKDLNETVEAFITEWCKKHNIPLDEDKIIINTETLLRDIINDETIGIEQAKYIIRNMRDYLASNRSKKFLFDNRSIIYNLKSSVADLINQIINARTPNVQVSEGMHINLPTRSEDLNNARRTLINSKPGQKVTFKVTGNSIAIIANGVEIGYLGKVIEDSDGTNLRLANLTRGLVWKFTNVNGEIKSNLDDLFINVIKSFASSTPSAYKEIANIIYYYANFFVNYKNFNPNMVLTDHIEILFNNPIIKELINKGDIKIPENLSNDEKVVIGQKIINDLASIIFNDLASTSLYDTNDVIEVYKTWTRAAYNNYSQTKQIQSTIDAGYTPNATISSIKVNTLGFSNDNIYDANDINVTRSRKINSNDNPIVYFLDDKTTVDDKGNSYNTRNIFRPGGAGFLLTVQGGKPIIASIVDTHKVKDTRFNNPVRNELTKLITDFTSGNISFEELGKKLSDLMGGVINGAGVGSNHLLSGVKVIEKNNKLWLTVNDKPIVVIYKNRNNSDAAGTGVTHINSRYNGGRVTISAADSRIINNIVNELMNNLKFNILYFMPKNANNSNVDNNEYFAKKDGKFVIKLKGIEETYDSYTDFVLDNNIALTNQELKADNTVINEYDITGVTIDVVGKDLTSDPVKGITTTNRSITDVITSATKENPANEVEVVQALGLDEEAINIIIGKVDNIPSLLPKNIVFDNKLKELAATDNNVTYISKQGLNELTKSKRSGIRLLLHERMHQLFNEQNVFARENIVQELLDSFNAAVNAAREIKPREPYYEVAKQFLDWVDNQGFNPESYKQSVTTKNSLESNRLFAEEWLVESITQPGLAEMLNHMEYKKADLKRAEKTSIWRKILNAIFKLLKVNSDGINNFTILAEHYIILSNSINSTNTESNTETNNENINNVTESNEDEIKESDDNEQGDKKDTKDYIINPDNPIDSEIENINIEEEYNTDNLDNDDLFDSLDDDEFASSKELIDSTGVSRNGDYNKNIFINPKGETPFINIEDYISTFPKDAQDNIRKMVNDNEIIFICR